MSPEGTLAGFFLGGVTVNSLGTSMTAFMPAVPPVRPISA